MLGTLEEEQVSDEFLQVDLSLMLSLWLYTKDVYFYNSCDDLLNFPQDLKHSYQVYLSFKL